MARDKEKRRESDRRRHEDAKLAYVALMQFYPFTLEDLPGEIWRPITNDYHVSNFGRVKSFKLKMPFILKPALNGVYLFVSLRIDGKYKQSLIHRLVAQAFIPNPDNKPEVNHRVGCKFNCHISNLEWATNEENQEHALRTGLFKSGEEHYKAKLTAEQVVYIRENPDNLTQQQLAEKFGADRRTIGEIQLGKTYANAGGSIRGKIDTRISDEIRKQILADYATGKFSQRALARKYGCSRATIWRILRESAE